MGRLAKHSRILLVLFFIMVPFLDYCSKDSGANLEMGEPCASYLDCKSGVCGSLPDDNLRRAYCTLECSGGEACPNGMVCAEFHEGARLCTYPCTDLTRFNEVYDPDYACIAGMPTLCDTLPYGNQCIHCGCAEGDYCDVYRNTCDTLIQEVEPCNRHEQCASGNCGSVGGGEDVCLAALGEACTNENCELCQAYGHFCSRYCDSDAECPTGMICAGRYGTFWCLNHCASDECCTPYPDCGHCDPVGSRCPMYQSCLRITYNDNIVDYGCYDDE
jgi:hypothetical protein